MGITFMFNLMVHKSTKNKLDNKVVNWSNQMTEHSTVRKTDGVANRPLKHKFIRHLVPICALVLLSVQLTIATPTSWPTLPKEENASNPGQENEVQKIAKLIGMLDSTNYNPRHLSSPLWNAKKVRLLRYQRGKLREQERNTDFGTKEQSVQTEKMLNEKSLDPFAKIFAIQSFVPKGRAYVDPKSAISQRSLKEWNELPWQGGRPRWRKFFWNGGGGATGVRLTK